MHNIYLGPVNNIFVFKQAGAELCQAQNKLSWVRLDWSNQITKWNLIKLIVLRTDLIDHTGGITQTD